MSETKRPPSRKPPPVPKHPPKRSASRAHAPKVSTPKLPSAGPAHSIGAGSSEATRIATCEADLAVARTELAAVKVEVMALRAGVEALREELALAVARLRKLPPPLPAENWDEVISVDERELILESIRPPPRSG